MSAKKYLTDAERDELIAKYAEDKLNNPPANITDKTLITNYGDEGQKGRLSIENFDVKVLTDPNFQTHTKTVENGNDTNVETKDEGVNSNATNNGETQKSGDVTDTNVGDTPKTSNETKDEKERAHQIDLYKELHDGQLPDASWTTDEISAANTTKQNANATLANADPNAAEFSRLFNDYLRLTGNRPFSGWDLEQLKAELEKDIETRAEKIKADQKAAEDANVTANIPATNDEEQIKLRHKDNGREIFVTKHTYDNFIAKNQPEWVKVAAVPKEIQ